MPEFTVSIDARALNENGWNKLCDYLIDEDVASTINDAVVDALGKLPVEIRDAITVEVR